MKIIEFNSYRLAIEAKQKFVYGKNLPSIIEIGGMVFETREYEDCPYGFIMMPLVCRESIASESLASVLYDMKNLSNTVIPNVLEIKLHAMERTSATCEQLKNELHDEYNFRIVNNSQIIYTRFIRFKIMNIINDKHENIKFGRITNKTKLIID